MHREYTGPKQVEVAAALDRWRSVRAEIDSVLTIDAVVEQTAPTRHHHFALAVALLGTGMIVALAHTYQPTQQNKTHSNAQSSVYDSSAHNNYSAQ